MSELGAARALCDDAMMAVEEAPARDLDDSSSGSSNVAVLALLLATVFWGIGFTWAKAAGERINARAGAPTGAALGPVLLLGVRFAAAAGLWLAIFPAARRGWTGRTIRRGLVLGAILAAGLVSQHLGLDRTSEAVSAFLTNLTVIFVPLLMALVSRKWPVGRVGVAIGVAAVGIWLMTGAAPQGFGYGALLGLVCAIVFSLYIVAVDRLLPGEDSSRLTAVQFIVVGVSCLALSALWSGSGGAWKVAIKGFAEERELWKPAALLTVLTTVGAFGLMMRFQPRIDPTRAALIYLAEPVVAAVWAWMMVPGRRLTAIELTGAGMILAANLLAGKGEKKGEDGE